MDTVFERCGGIDSIHDVVVEFSDESLRRAHAHLGITRAEFAEILDIMQEALKRHHVAPSDIDHVVRAVMRREPLIVAEVEEAGPPE